MKILKMSMMTLVLALGALLVPESVEAQFEWECLECRAHDNGDGTWDIVFGGTCDEGASFASTGSGQQQAGSDFDSCVDCDGGGESCEGRWSEFDFDACNLFSCQGGATGVSGQLMDALRVADFKTVVRMAAENPETVTWDADRNMLQTRTCTGQVWSNIPVSADAAVHLEAAFR